MTGTAERLSSDGFGEERPIAANKKLEGRAANRRVEFLIVGTFESTVTETVLPPTTVPATPAAAKPASN